MNETKIRVGDIFVCRWGVVDKIVDFYQVIKKTKNTVVVKKLENKVVKKLHRDGPAGENLVVPNTKFGEKIDEPEMRKKIQKNGTLRMTNYASAYKWDGKPVREIFGYY